MRLAANISLLFTEAPLEDRPALAAEAGFEGSEILFPYDSDAQALKRARKSSAEQWDEAKSDVDEALQGLEERYNDMLEAMKTS